MKKILPTHDGWSRFLIETIIHTMKTWNIKGSTAALKKKTATITPPGDFSFGKTRIYGRADGSYAYGHQADKDRDVLYVLRRKQIVPVVSGNFDASKVQITPEMYREKVNNPQGKGGSYDRYIPGAHITDNDDILERGYSTLDNLRYRRPEHDNDQVLTGDTKKYNALLGLGIKSAKPTAGAYRRSSAPAPGRPCCRSATTLPTTTASSPAMPV